MPASTPPGSTVDRVRQAVLHFGRRRRRRRGGRLKPGTSCTAWCRLPPSATLVSCEPRQMANSGTPRASAFGISGSVQASRSGSSGRAGSCTPSSKWLRVHVGRRAGQQHAVGQIEQRIEFVGLRARHHQRQAAGQAHRIDVLLAGDVERVLAEHAVAGRHQHDGLGVRARHNRSFKSVIGHAEHQRRRAQQRAAGEGAVLQAREGVEARRRRRPWPRPPACRPGRSAPGRGPRSLAGSRRCSRRTPGRRPKSGARFIEMSTKPPQAYSTSTPCSCGKVCDHALAACSRPGSSAWPCCS